MDHANIVESSGKSGGMDPYAHHQAGFIWLLNNNIMQGFFFDPYRNGAFLH
jgi:hypothetical protein